MAPRSFEVMGAARRRPGQSSPRCAVFRQEGEYWTIAYDGIVVHLKEAKGLHYIAALLRYPGREVHVGDLRAASSRHPVAEASAVGTPTGRRRHGSASFGRFGPGWTGDAAPARRDEEWHLDGKADPAERLRKAVTNRIRDSVARIRERHDPLGRHLANAIRTGIFCSYAPEKLTPWTL